jgi:hypothetical protein
MPQGAGRGQLIYLIPIPLGCSHWHQAERASRSVQKQKRRQSGGRAVVIVKHPSWTLAPMHRVRWGDDRGDPQGLVCEALMIAFAVVMRHEVGDRMLKRGLSEKDHSVQTLGFY